MIYFLFYDSFFRFHQCFNNGILMKNLLLIIVIAFLFMISGCSIFDGNNSNSGFAPLPDEEVASFFETDTTHAFSFIVQRRPAENKDDIIFNDTLHFKTSMDSMLSNTYKDMEELENQYADNPKLVLSQQQFKVFYSIELTEFLTDTTYMVVEERENSDEMDTTYYEISQNFIDSVYAEEELTFHESADVVINLFDHKSELQEASHERFKQGITASDLDWLPSNSYAPSTRLFWNYPDAVVFGAHSINTETTSHQIMQQTIHRSLDAHLQ